MKQTNQKLAEEIYLNLIPRLDEALKNESWNRAYIYALGVGCVSDIKKVLDKKIGRK